MSASSGPTHLVLYDGVCGLCNRFVRFLLDHDRRRVLTFAALQGETASRLRHRSASVEGLDTVVLVENLGSELEQISTRSTAALRTLGLLGGGWRAFFWLLVIPRRVRDFGYRLIATRRYRWFGRFDDCPLPPPAMRERFLD